MAQGGNSVNTPKFNTQTSSGTQVIAPTIALTTTSTTQIPTHAVSILNQTAGEEPLYLVHMKDGTYVYLKESLLSQANGKIVI